MRRSFTIAALFVLTAMPVHAARVAFQVVDAGGKPVADAVVSLAPDAAMVARPLVAASHIVDQSDETFAPYVTALHPGDSVVFRNSDTTRHQVYSFSDIAKFENVLAPGQSSPPLVLKTPGFAAVGCNIHDNMLTYLYVTTDPDMAVTDRQGAATLDGVPAGQYKAHVWHPQMRPGVALPLQAVTVGADVPARVRFTLALLPDPRGAMDREHMGY